MTDHIQLPPPDYTENVQGFVHDTQRHYYSEETMRAYAERLHAARVNSPAILQAIGLLTTLQSWIGARSPQDSGPEEQTLWDQIEATRIALTPLAPAGAPTTQAAPAHPDDAAVDALAATMKAKLTKQRAKGYSGWGTPECTQQRLSDMLRAHVDKGDPVDVANFCAFLAARGEGIAQAAPAAQGEPLAEELRATQLAAPEEPWDAVIACIRIIDECDTSNPAFHIAAEALSSAAARSQGKEGGA